MYDTLNQGKSLLTTAVVVSPNFGHDRLILAGAKGGIMRTDDDGKNWRAMLFPPPAPLITTMVASPNFAQDGLVLVGTAEDGVFCSTDYGMHWKARNFGLLDLSVFSIALSLHFSDDQTAYAGTESGLFKSTNGGRSWRAVPFPTSATPVISLAVLGQCIFAGTEAHGLYASSDDGQTWERQDAAAIPNMVNAILPHFPDSQDDVTLLLDTKILTSYDQGRTWSLWVDLGQPASVIAASAPAHAALVGTISGHIWRVQAGSTSLLHQ
jgi:photosystem II stability/assembly factor-like uncharacterized protein